VRVNGDALCVVMQMEELGSGEVVGFRSRLWRVKDPVPLAWYW
jgi:hypothetical protein